MNIKKGKHMERKNKARLTFTRKMLKDKRNNKIHGAKVICFRIRSSFARRKLLKFISESESAIE